MTKLELMTVLLSLNKLLKKGLNEEAMAVIDEILEEAKATKEKKSE
jgi:hypothetical protein